MVRNKNIDALRIILAFLIVLLHYNFASPMANNILYPFFRIATGMFFIITGYLISCKETIGENYWKEKGLQTFVLSCKYTVIIGLLLYCWFSLINWQLVPINMIFTYGELPSLTGILKFLFVNVPFIHGTTHLWYLFAESYALIFIHFFRKKARILDILAVVNFAMFTFMQILFPYPYLTFMFGNWFLFAFPMIWFGYRLNVILEKLNISGIKILTFGAMFYLFAILIHYHLNPNVSFAKEIYFPSSGIFFALGIIHCIGSHSPIAYKVAEIGKKYSKFIYIWHFPIGMIFFDICRLLKIDKLSAVINISGIAIFILCLCMAAIHSFCQKNIFNR